MSRLHWQRAPLLVGLFVSLHAPGDEQPERIFLRIENQDSLEATVRIKSGVNTETIRLARSGGIASLFLAPDALVTIEGSGIGSYIAQAQELAPCCTIRSEYKPNSKGMKQIKIVACLPHSA